MKKKCLMCKKEEMEWDRRGKNKNNTRDVDVAATSASRTTNVHHRRPTHHFFLSYMCIYTRVAKVYC